MQNSPETIREKLAAIKRLADQGVDGERENASRMLESLLKRYSLTEEDLVMEKETDTFQLKYKTPQEMTLALQIIGYVKNQSTVEYWNHPKTKAVIVKCSPRQAVELNELYGHYLKAWRSSLDEFMSAFISANGLVPEAAYHQASDFSIEDLMRIRRRHQLAENIIPTPPTRKQLASAKPTKE